MRTSKNYAPRKPRPMASGIVRNSQYHCDNNELAELSVVRHKSKEFAARSLCSCGSSDEKDPETSTNESFNVVASGKVRIHVNQRYALKDATDAHKVLEPRATSGAIVLNIEPTIHRSVHEQDRSYLTGTRAAGGPVFPGR